MKYSKPKYYLFAFSLFYLFLIGIMTFYFLQVLALKDNEIHKIAHDKIDDIEPLLSFEKKAKRHDNILYQSVLELLDKKTTIEEIKAKHATYFQSIKEDATQKTDSAFRDLGYRVSYRIDLTDVILNSTKENLLPAPVSILETQEPVNKAYRVNTSTWEVEESSINKAEETCLDCPEDYSNHFTVKQEKYLEVRNFYSLAFRDLAPLLLGSFLICAFLLVLYYITYKTIKKKEQEMLSLHNMVDNVSHEFKLPIATLKYGCNNLKQEYNSPTVELIQRQVNRLERLQHQLGGFVAYTDQPFTRTHLVELIADLQHRTPNLQIDLYWELDEELHIAQTEMETILLNLLENSIKYGATRITCSLKKQKKYWCIQVTDDGMGIEKAEHPLIFQKFYRIRQDNIHNTVGLGIGLYQVKQLVEQHRGSIRLKSKVTEGTTFTILLPYV